MKNTVGRSVQLKSCCQHFHRVTIFISAQLDAGKPFSRDFVHVVWKCNVNHSYMYPGITMTTCFDKMRVLIAFSSR